MSAFLKLLWSGRERRSPHRESIQERIAQYSVRAAWDVKASPVRPPVKEKPGA